MKKNKFLAVILSFMLVFSFAFANTSDAATTPSYAPTSNVRSGNYMYYAVYGEIYKVNTNTNESTSIRYINNKWVSDLIVYDGWLYFTCYDAGTGAAPKPYIYRVRTNGQNLQRLGKGHSPFVYKSKVYYIKVSFDTYSESDYDILGIYKMSLSGTKQQLVKKSTTVSEFVVYKSNIYYVTYSNSTGKNYLRKTNLYGSKSKIMTTSSYGISGLIIYYDYVYFNSGYYDDNIYRIKTSSTKKYRYLEDAHLMDISNGYVYYTMNDYYYDTYYLCKIKINKSINSYLITNYGPIESAYVSQNSMLVTYFVDDDYYANTYLSIFDTNGDNENILNTYFQS